MALKSLATAGRLAVRGWNVAAQTRETKKLHRTQADAGANAGSVLANPRSR